MGLLSSQPEAVSRVTMRQDMRTLGDRSKPSAALAHNQILVPPQTSTLEGVQLNEMTSRTPFLMLWATVITYQFPYGEDLRVWKTQI